MPSNGHTVFVNAYTEIKMMLCLILTMTLVFTVSAKDPYRAGVCDGDRLCDKDHDDYLTTLETVGDPAQEQVAGDEKPGQEGTPRKKRQTADDLLPQPLEVNFNFTDDRTYFYDLLNGTALHNKTLFHLQTPAGFAESDRTKLLLYNVRNSAYPPFTYRGFFGKNNWHKIPPETLMKKRNRSFMMLSHQCEQMATRQLERECAGREYQLLPNCSHEEQSPMNIDTSRARDSSLREFEFTNLKGSDGVPIAFPFSMSLPWDGTDVLTVELLGTQASPAVEKGSISGRKLHLERIHIHYGENETVGSEHTINNLTYSMELQFIFTLRASADESRQPTDRQYWDFLMDYYTPAGEQDRLKNVHIIAMWVKVIHDQQYLEGVGDWSDKWNLDAVEAFAVLARAARKFWYIHNTLQDPPPTANSPEKFKYRAAVSIGSEMLELGAFFPPQVLRKINLDYRDSIYYNYKGSITHPPCFGYVEWDIYDRPLYIPTQMWLNFLYIHSEFDDTKYVAGNYRQPRNVYVASLDTRNKQPFTARDEEERQQAVGRISRRDLRRSRPTGIELENYDYDPDQDTLSSATTSVSIFTMLMLMVTGILAV